VLSALTALAQDPNNKVWIVSGRDQSFLEKWLGHIPNMGLSAEHGCFVCEPGNPEWSSAVSEKELAWRTEVDEIFSYFTEKTPGAVIERKRCALTWHYRNSDPELGEKQARACAKELHDKIVPKWGVGVLTGKANLEVRPKGVNKGSVVERLVRREQPDFTLCAGDDETDEDMFRVLEGSDGVSIIVAPHPNQTCAKFYVPATDGVVDLLQSLASANRQ
jgi:trehalose 6-phosphate synthase/phosphatase